MNLQLEPQTEARIQQRIKSGKYATPHDVVVAGLRLLEEMDQSPAERMEHIREMISKGLDELDRGEGLDGEQVFFELLEEMGDEQDAK